MSVLWGFSPLHFTENLTGWKKRRPRRRRAKNKRRKAKESTRKSRIAATAQATPPTAAAAVTATPIQTTTASPRAKRRRRTREKIPVGITAQRASEESRVRERPPLTEAGHRAPTLDRGGLKRTLEIIDKEGQKGEGAGVAITAQRTRSSWREVKREGGTTAGPGRKSAALRLDWTEVEAAREAGRTGIKTDVTVETVRGAKDAQTETKAEQLIGGAEAERGEKKEKFEEELGAGVGIGGREAGRG